MSNINTPWAISNYAIATHLILYLKWVRKFCIWECIVGEIHWKVKSWLLLLRDTSHLRCICWRLSTMQNSAEECRPTSDGSSLIPSMVHLPFHDSLHREFGVQSSKRMYYRFVTCLLVWRNSVETWYNSLLYSPAAGCTVMSLASSGNK